MIFQALDDKRHCALYCSEQTISRDCPDEGKTWDYIPALKDKNKVEYAYLYSQKDLDYSCPEHYTDEWIAIRKRMAAFVKSFKTAKVDLNRVCFYDLVPESFLLKFCESKDVIVRHIFDNYKKPNNYNFLLDVRKMIADIRTNKLNLDERVPGIKNGSFLPYIKYDLFGHKTGRLRTSANYFPALTLKKTLRRVLRPSNDVFLELDYNNADGRVLLALMGHEQPIDDIHEYHIKYIFGNIAREEAKRRFFAWLYNPDSKDEALERLYDKERVKSKYYMGGKIINAYGREFESDDYHALNYINASTCADLCLRQFTKLHNLLEGKKSKITLLHHDSALIDLALGEQGLVKSLIESYSETDFGKFVVNMSVGENWGEMEKFNERI